MRTLLRGRRELWKCPTGRFHHNETFWRCLTVWPLGHYRTRKSADLETQCSLTHSHLHHMWFVMYCNNTTHNRSPIRAFMVNEYPKYWTVKCGRIYFLNQQTEEGEQWFLPSPETVHWNWAGCPSATRMSRMGAMRTGAETRAAVSATSGTGRQTRQKHNQWWVLVITFSSATICCFSSFDQTANRISSGV